MFGRRFREVERNFEDYAADRFEKCSLGKAADDAMIIEDEDDTPFDFTSNETTNDNVKTMVENGTIVRYVELEDGTIVRLPEVE